MATRVQKDLFIAVGDLRDKYQWRGDVIGSFCKAIARATQTTIESQVMRNGTVKFEVIGRKGGVNKAKRNIVGQFCKESTKTKYIDAPKETVIRSSQEAMKLLPESEQLNLLNEGNRFLLTEAALNKHNLLTGASELREFACGSCDHFWWRVVPRTKPVSRCRKCNERYDALPRDKEFGIGRYLCTECGHSFNKKCTATDTFFCYNCKSEVRTPYIHPKFLRHSPPTPKTPKQPPVPIPQRHSPPTPKTPKQPPVPIPQRHSPPTPKTPKQPPVPIPQRQPRLFIPPVLIPQIQYQATQPPCVPYEPDKSKSHASPKFKKKKVIHASTLHESTGSTISTILTQTEDLNYEFMTISDSSSESSESDDEEYPASTATSETVDTTDTESNSDTEALAGSHSESDYSHPITRRRISASDSDSDLPDNNDQDPSKKPSAMGSDSGIDSATVSSNRSSARSISGSYASAVKGHINPFSSIESKGDFSGVIFSKSCAQQTVDRRGATITGEGIILIVPEGAVPSTDQVVISLQGCLGGPFVPPDDYIFASPVFLISPPFVFHRAVVLRIDHFACLETEEDCGDMIFVSSPTKPTISDRGEATWRFYQYHHYGNPQFNPHSGYGETHLKHFCFAAFARKRKRGLKDWYHISLHMPQTYGLSLCHAIFSVTLHHKVFTENLQRFLDINFKNETFRPVCVTIRSNKLEEEIELNIPRAVVNAQGYRIVPDIDPCKISKDQIDYPRECKKRALKDIAIYPPRIVLTIKFQAVHPSLELECPLEVTGIASTTPVKFNLLVNPTTQSDYSSQSSVKGSTCGRNKDALGEKHQYTISRYLKQIDSAEIIRLGGALGLFYHKLLSMKLMPEDMVAAWIRGEDNSPEKGVPSWRILGNALEEIGQTGVAKKIQEEQILGRTE